MKLVPFDFEYEGPFGSEMQGSWLFDGNLLEFSL